MERLVTHYFADDLDPDNWVSLCFLTQDENNHFYSGFEEVQMPQDEVERRVSVKELSPLDQAWPIREGQELWHTPYGDIWLTSGEDPIEDPKRILLKKGDDATILSRHESIFRRPASARHLRYVPDDYLDGPIYSKFSEDVAEQIAKQIGLLHVRKLSILAKWELLGSAYEEGAVDFTGLAYFLHPGRAVQHAVVPIGVLETFTLYFNQKSRNLNYTANPLFDSNLPIERRIDEGLKSNPKLSFGVIAHTAATREFLKVFRDNSFELIADHALKIASEPAAIADWLREDLSNRVVVCDHNFIAALDQEKVVQISNTPAFESETPRTLIPFKLPLPVGFFYPRADERWGHEIRKATAEVVRAFILKDDNYSTLAIELQDKLRVRLLPREQLCSSLGIQDAEASRFQRERTRAS